MKSSNITIQINGNFYTVPLAVAEEVEFLRGELARSLALDGELRDKLDRLWGESAPHKSGDTCISYERLATESGFPYCDSRTATSAS